MLIITTNPLADAKLQDLFASAIDGAMAFGHQNVRRPPEDHWLLRWWQAGRDMAVSEQRDADAEPVAWANSETLAARGKRFIIVWSERTSLYPIPLYAGCAPDKQEGSA